MSVLKIVPPEARARVRLPVELPPVLRDLANDIEAGKITEFIGMYLDEEGYYQYLTPSPKHDSLVMATLMQANMADRYRGKT